MGKWVHRLSEVDEVEKTAMCANCGPVEAVYKPHRDHWVCRIADRKFKGSRVRNGCPPEKFEEMLREQDGKCALCNRRITSDDACADHDHETGKLRKLLCRSCNIGLGLFQDDPALLRLAAKYITRHKQNPAHQHR